MLSLQHKTSLSGFMAQANGSNLRNSEGKVGMTREVTKLSAIKDNKLGKSDQGARRMNCRPPSLPRPPPPRRGGEGGGHARDSRQAAECMDRGEEERREGKKGGKERELSQ